MRGVLQLSAGHQYRSTFDSTRSKAFQRLIGFSQWKGLHGRSHRHTWGQGNELFRIPTSEIGHRAQNALFPEQVIREGRDVAHVNAAADHDAARGDSLQRPQHKLTRRREDDCRIELLWRQSLRIPSPDRAQ